MAGSDSSMCDLSEYDSLTEDLDQIGRLNLPSILDYWTTDHLPTLLQLTGMSGFPQMPALPQMPQMPQFGGLPSANMPSFDLTDLSNYFAQYVKAATSHVDKAAQLATLINSLKTALATRIQMNTFLLALRGGETLQDAIGRLQVISAKIHQAVTLPVDEFDAQEPETEPVGVAGIVNRERPFVTDVVLPEAAQIKGLLHPTATRTTDHRGWHSTHILSDDSLGYTDWDAGDEVTPEEAELLTHLDSLEDFFKDGLLRKKIQTIHNMPRLSQTLKNRLTTRLMMGNYLKYKGEAQGPQVPGLVSSPTESSAQPQAETAESESGSGPRMADDEVALTPADTAPSYHSQTPPVLGCPHYQRNCKLECPTCRQWFVCRFCHDAAVPDHRLQRAAVKHVLCMRCGVPQEPETGDCVNCEEELANYFCGKCVLYDNDPDKEIYHCDKCGICRLGLGLDKDYFHCDTCNICLLIDLKQRHRCVTNTTHCNCPICNEYLFTSVSKVVFMKCGHLIHQSCYDEMIQHLYKCPICKKTVVNTETQFRILDQEIRLQPLPPPYDKWRCIISCNDCKGKSNCAYHVMGLKCKYCRSYNTNQLKLIKPEEGVESEASLDEEAGNERISTMRLMKTNLGSNFLIENNTRESDRGVASHDDDDYDSENDSENNDDFTMLVDMKRLKNTIMGEKVERTSISQMFQNFVNATLKQ